MLKKEEVKSTWDRNRINMIQSYIQKNLQYINTQWEQKEVGLLPCKKKNLEHNFTTALHL